MCIRDSYKTHYEISKPFLEAGKYVFIDKPFSLNKKELDFFKPFLEKNQLFSASGIKYARELDYIRNLDNKDFKFIRATCVKNWDKYGIHMLDGIFSIIDWKVKEVKRVQNNYFLICENEKIIEICMLGNYSKPILKFEFFGNEYYEIEIKDYFLAFKRLLANFINMIENKNQSSSNTIKLMNILIEGLE
jgi:hypothetical protein